MNSSVNAQMKNIITNLENKAVSIAEQELRGGIDALLMAAYEELKGFQNLTGNAVNSLGVALYHDGALLEVHSSVDLTGKRPIRTTLKSGDIFNEPMTYDGNKLNYPIGGHHPKRDWVGDRNFWADEEAIAWLNSNPPRKRGFAYKIVSAIDYAKYLEAKEKVNILSQLHDELEAMGADVSDLNSGT